MIKAIKTHKREAIIGLAFVMLAAVLLGVFSCASGANASSNVEAGEVSDTRAEISSSVTASVEEDASKEAESGPDKVVGGGADTQSSADANNTTQPQGSANGSTPATTSSTTEQPIAKASGESNKRWVDDFQRVWVEDRAPWTEKVPIRDSKEVSICNTCGADVTGNVASHAKAHMLAGENGGHHSEVREYISGFENISHPAEGHYENKIVGGHWE